MRMPCWWPPTGPPFSREARGGGQAEADESVVAGAVLAWAED
jgi:hypothetical protein